MVVVLENESIEEDFVLTAWLTVCVDSIAAAHMMKDNSIISECKVLMRAPIETVGSKVVWATSQAESKVGPSS